jgi:hypothetical protein
MNPELNREYPDPSEAKLIEEMVKVSLAFVESRVAEVGGRNGAVDT